MTKLWLNMIKSWHGMTSFLTWEGPWHSDILFWIRDWSIHLLFLSHHCLKGRNYFSHFSDGETETQKSQKDSANYLREWMSKSHKAVNNPGPWIPNPLPTINPCGGQKESRFPNSPSGKIYTSVHLSGLSFFISVCYEGVGRGPFEAGLTGSCLVDPSLSKKRRRCPGRMLWD